jgi:hypothetical protein
MIGRICCIKSYYESCVTDELQQLEICRKIEELFQAKICTVVITRADGTRVAHGCEAIKLNNAIACVEITFRSGRMMKFFSPRIPKIIG